MHLSQKNSSAAFEQLNRCLDNVKKWLTNSKLKLNPDKSEFIIFGSKRQRDKLKACFPMDILGNPHSPVESVKNLSVWFDSDFSLSKQSCFVQLRVFRHVSFLLIKILYLWLMLLLVVGWITATHFSGVSPSSIYVNYRAFKKSPARIVSNNSRYTRITPVLMKLHWLPVEHHSF